MKRILTIQDISCIGKCSITVALPIISALGIETAIIPTGLLSTHTMFKNYTFKDLTDQIVPITNHWKSENIDFSCIYTGYLGTLDQIDIVSALFNEFRTEDNLIVVDPAMADNGKLYPAFDESYAQAMAKLCNDANIIVPNITEAAFMTGMEYQESYDEDYIKEMLHKLADLGPKISILTGVGFNQGKTGAMGYDKELDDFYYYEHEMIDTCYHGTGDVFASTLVGSMENGLTWQEAISVAADYTAKCIELTVNDPEGRDYGVNFEEGIPYLLKRIGK